MPEPPEIRVRWTLTLWGPRAADDPEHSIAGSGDTPDEAIRSLLARLEEKADLLHNFRAQARMERDAG